MQVSRLGTDYDLIGEGNEVHTPTAQTHREIQAGAKETQSREKDKKYKRENTRARPWP